MNSAAARLSLDNLPNVWRAPEIARDRESVVSTGHAELDKHLPGGGWPLGGLVEILQGKAGRHVWQLLLPALSSHARTEHGPVVMVDPPHVPFAPALAAQGLGPERLLRIAAGKPQSALWASEQALKCSDVIALLAWLPRCRGAELRRLQLAAAQHGKLLFVFRGLEARNESSPSRLKLAIEDSDSLQVTVLKRRGPPLEEAVKLPSHPDRLQQLLDSRKRRRLPINPDRSHVLDRTVALA